MSPKLYQRLSMKVITCVFILAYASFPLTSGTITALLDTRQAIPVAMVQSKALTGHAIANKTKSHTDNDSCNKTSVYCDPFINHQYKLDQEMRNTPSNFNITDSTYNASIIHALATNKTTVTRNKTIVFLQNQGPKNSKPPTEKFPTLMELTNLTFPLNKTITNKTIYLPPYGSLRPSAQDQTPDLSVPFSQAVESGKIYIPSFVNKAYMPEVEQTNETSNGVPFYSNNTTNTFMPAGESRIQQIQNFLEPSAARFLFNQTSHKVPIIRIEVRPHSPLQIVPTLTEQTNIASPLNQTLDKGESSVTSYGNTTSSGYMPVNSTEESNTPTLENTQMSTQQGNATFPENSAQYVSSTSTNKTDIDMTQETSSSLPQNTERFEQLNSTLGRYGLYIPPPSALNSLNSSSYIKAIKRNDMEKNKDIKRGKMERKGNRKGKVYPHKRSKIKNQFLLTHAHQRSRRGSPTIEVSVKGSKEEVSKDLEQKTNHRVKRFIFDYDSDTDDLNELPAIFPGASYLPSPPLVTYESSDLDAAPKTGRSDISQPPLDAYEDALFPDDNFMRPNLIDTNAIQRGRIEIPDNYERSPPAIGEPAKQMINQLLEGRGLDHAVDSDFFRFRYGSQGKTPLVNAPPRWESPSLRNDIVGSLNSKAEPDLGNVPRSEQDKLREDEMGMILDKFDRQTQKIANLYKYLEPGKDVPIDGYNAPRAPVRQDSQHYELIDPQNIAKSSELGKRWGPSSYHLDLPNANTIVETKHDPQNILRTIEESKGLGPSSYHPDLPNANTMGQAKQDPPNIQRTIEESKRLGASSGLYNPDLPNTNLLAKQVSYNNLQGLDHSDLRPDSDRRNLVWGNPPEPGVQYNKEEITRELVNYIKNIQQQAALQSNPQTPNLADLPSQSGGDTRGFISNPSSIQEPSMAETDNNRNVPDNNQNPQYAALSNLLKSVVSAYKDRNNIQQDTANIRAQVSPSLPLQDSSMDFPAPPSSYPQSADKKETLGAAAVQDVSAPAVQYNSAPAVQDVSDLAGHNSIANERGVVMLLIATPKSKEDDDSTERKETVQHKKLTTDGVKRVHTSADDKGDEGNDEDDDFSKNLKEATNLVLGDELKAGNITTDQVDDIEDKLKKILDIQHKNKTSGLMRVDEFINKTGRTHRDVVKKSKTPKADKGFRKLPQAPPDPVMYLNFESTRNDDKIPDKSGNHNNAIFEDPAGISKRVLGTCGKAGEINDGSITWRGSKFHRKPEKAVTIAMWVKVKKSGVINWFANGKEGDKLFESKSNGIAVPAKVWTHVAGTFDSKTGLARIYINGDIEQETKKNGGVNLSQNWLVNGIGGPFGDDSIQYIDELFVYDRALNSSEIEKLVNRCVFNRMVLHYGFQESNKTNVHDQSGLENNGILTGGARVKHDCNKCGYCVDLQNGPDPSLKVQQISVQNLPRVKVSIAVWVSLNDTKGVHNIFKTESAKGNIGYELQVKDGKVRWYIASDKGHTIFDNTTKKVVIPEALWTHIIVSFNNENGVVSIYANSILKLKDKVPVPRRKYLPINWDNDASIGDSSYNGYLDEFIMYNWELDSSEVLYVRNYCADHPKLVRFTVRVPLTKKAIVPPRPKSDVGRHVTSREKALKAPKRPLSWWGIYKRLLERKNEVTRRTLSTLKNFQQSLSTAYPLLK